MSWLGNVQRAAEADDLPNAPYIQQVVLDSLLRLFYRATELIRISPKPYRRLLEFGAHMRPSLLGSRPCPFVQSLPPRKDGPKKALQVVCLNIPEQDFSDAALVERASLERETACHTPHGFHCC